MTRVLAHFADDPTRVYQLLPWLPVLAELDGEQPVAIVTRDPGTAALVRARTALPVHLAPTLTELTELYADLDAAVVLYCNNSPLNFSSLLDARLLHVHVNHGESDKHSSASNNAKAYDRVFVAGEAAVQRHRSGLMEYDVRRLVRTGRPQLDVARAPVLPSSDRRTVLYAPTWEGDADYNNYTSLDVLGPRIVSAALAVSGVRLVYKPHPKVVTSADPDIVHAHRTVLDLIDAAVAAEPGAGHVAVTAGDVLAVMDGCDLMVCDVSSAGLDWLYLHAERPLLIADRYADPERLRSEVAVSGCADIVDEGSVGDLTGVLTDRLVRDRHRPARAAMRRHYFDDVAVGESTGLFLSAVGDLVALRDELLAQSGGTA